VPSPPRVESFLFVFIFIFIKIICERREKISSINRPYTDKQRRERRERKRQDKREMAQGTLNNPPQITHRPETPKPDPPVPNEPDTGEGDGITDYKS
jgi:hypothetical protein